MLTRPAYFSSPEVAEKTCDMARAAIAPHVAASPEVKPFVDRENADASTPKGMQDWESMSRCGRQASAIAAAVDVAGHGRGFSALSDTLYRQADIKNHDMSVRREDEVRAGESRIDTMRRAARQMVKGNPESIHQAKDASLRVLPECMHDVARDVPALFPNSRVEETALEVAAMGKGRSSKVFSQRLAGLKGKDYDHAVAGLSVAALSRAEQEGSLDQDGRLMSRAMAKAGRNGEMVNTASLSGLVDRLPKTSPARGLVETVAAAEKLRSDRTRDRSTVNARNDERVA